MPNSGPFQAEVPLLALVECQRETLRRLAEGAPLAVVMEELARRTESLSDVPLRVSILLLDEDGKRLLHCAAPSLPEAFVKATDGLHCAAAGLTCAAAVARGETVCTADIASDAAWMPLWQLALSHEVRACLAVPVRSCSGRILGVLACYFDHPLPAGLPSAENGVLALLVQTVALAVDQHESARARNADEQLAAVNARLRTQVAERTRERDRIWHNSMDLLLAIGTDGVLRAVNPAWTAALGYQPGELTGRHFQPFVHPDDVVATEAAIAEASEKPLEHFEVRLRHKDGSYRWFDWRAAPGDGVVYANGRDITIEKRQAEQLLLANAARLQLALEAGEMGAWEWEPGSNTARWLHGTAALHGLTSTEEAGQVSMEEYLQRFVHPEDRTILAAAMERAVSDGNNHRAEYRIICPNGNVQWIEARGEMFCDGTGAQALMVGVSVNITRRKRIEEDLQFLAQASAELAALVDPQVTLDRLAFLAVPSFADWCAIDLLDPDGKLERVAVAHVDPRKVHLAHELHRRFPPDPNRQQGAWNVLRSGRAEHVHELTDAMLEQAISDPDRLAAIRELGLRSYIGVPLCAHGKMLGVMTFIGAESGRLFSAEDLALAEDLGRRAAVAIENAGLYRALRESDYAKDVFLAMLAHELRSPLAALSNGLALLGMTSADEKRVSHYAALMERQVGQLTRLVDDLMDISRIKTGKIELKVERTSLAAVLNSAIETSRGQMEAGQHRLLVSLPAGATDLDGDPVRLAQVFSNLLTNAAKYTDPGGRIELVLEAKPDEFVVRVRDNGIGIAQDMLTRIFKLFTQVTHPVERSRGGLGIGLSLVEGLVRMHGGKVEAFSEGPGRGSEFVVTLPRRPARPSAAPAQRDEQPAATPLQRRVLVVDDNMDAAAAVADILVELGHEVRVAHDGLTAVSLFKELAPDVVLLDIGLPGIDGYEVARRIRATDRSDPPVVLIALTGWGQAHDRQRAFDAGFDRHWVKPAGVDLLREISLAR